MVIVPNFCFKEFRFGLHADFFVLVDFLHVLGSIEGRSISAPNTFKQTLVLFCHNYRFINPSWDVLHLDMFGMSWCMFVDKGRQGSVILVVQVFVGTTEGSNPSLTKKPNPPPRQISRGC